METWSHFVFQAFWNSLYNSGWPQSPSIPPVSASPVMEWWAYATTPGLCRLVLISWPFCLSLPRTRMKGRCCNTWPSTVFYIRKPSLVGTTGLVCQVGSASHCRMSFTYYWNLPFVLLVYWGGQKRDDLCFQREGHETRSTGCVFCQMASFNSTCRTKNQSPGRSWETLGHHFLIIMES